MSDLTIHRYRLQPYAGPKSRATCPSCGKPRCFTHYLDTITGELLPDEYGRCDREANCGHQFSPYEIDTTGLSYARQVGLNERQATSLTIGPHRPPWLPRAAPTTQQPTSILTFPHGVFTATLGNYERNNLAHLLRHHFGLGVADELLARFQLGTSAHWPGACVFWLIDEQSRVRGGQVVLYDETGHTVKEPYRCTTWAHTALARACRNRNEAPPAWLANYEANGQKSPCLFGLPQLASTPAGQPVALVESAKTAMMATPYFTRYTWLATMGLSYLTPERLEPLRGRRIVLLPDAGALAQWQAKADKLCRLGFDVKVSAELEKLVTDEQRRAGFDLADVLLNEWAGYPPSWDDTALTPVENDSIVNAHEVKTHA